MAISVVMPALEMAQETGKLIAWLKKEGEKVSKGELLLEVETDKAVMEIESPGDGVLAGVSAQPGAEIRVGKTIAWIVQPGEQPPESADDAQSGRYSGSESTTTHATPAKVAPTSADVLVSPKARRLAKEHGIALEDIRGTGPNGEILAEDVLKAAAQSAVPTKNAALSARTGPDSIARLMAQKTAESWTTAPHFFVVREVDVRQFEKFRADVSHSIESLHRVKVSVTDLLVSLVARALTRHPELNSSWIDEKVRRNPDVNIAIAIAVEGGVVAPVIQNAERLALHEIAAQRLELAQRARNGKLRPADLAGGTFTVSNLGMFDVDAFSAIITPPQAAILAVGRIADRVVAVAGAPAVRPMMTLTLSSDHRVLDGACAARFMKTLTEMIQHPAEILS